MQSVLSSEEIIAATLFLMTRYSLNQEITIAKMIETHLLMLAHHPENQSDLMQEVSMKLREKWQSISDYQEFNLQLVS